VAELSGFANTGLMSPISPPRRDQSAGHDHGLPLITVGQVGRMKSFICCEPALVESASVQPGITTPPLNDSSYRFSLSTNCSKTLPSHQVPWYCTFPYPSAVWALPAFVIEYCRPLGRATSRVSSCFLPPGMLSPLSFLLARTISFLRFSGLLQYN